MNAPDTAATLQALASHFLDCAEYCATGGSNDRKFRALAEHVEGVASRHTDGQPPDGICEWCDGLQDYPCAEVRELLAVAAAAGVKP